MFRDIAFGQYYPTNSLVHKLDARVKLLLTILFVVVIFFIKSYFGFMLTAFVLTVIILSARVPIMSVLKSVRGIIFIILFNFRNLIVSNFLHNSFYHISSYKFSCFIF